MTTSRLDQTSTADDVLAGIDLTGRTALVTGASSGIGAETARALAAHGARVVLSGRDVPKTEAVAAAIRAATPGAELEVMELHLEIPASVRAFATGFLARHRALHLLIANAGVMACPLARTAEGWEMQLATNHFGHYSLTALLAPALRAGTPARLVSVSSAGHRFSPVVFEDPHYERRAYDKWSAYGQSKTANIWFALGLDRRLARDGVRAFAIHPGMIPTELGRHLEPADVEQIRARSSQEGGMRVRRVVKTIPQGAATQLYAATSPALEGRGGLYLEDCQVSGLEPPEGSSGCAAWAFDAEGAEQLWAYSERTLGTGLPG